MIRTLCIVFLVVLLLAPAGPARAADAVVGLGTPASCTESAFTTALNIVQSGASGTISFNCGGPAAIVFSSQKTITKNVTIQGAGQITLSGGNSTRIFNVILGGRLTLQALTLSNGFAPFDGGAIFSNGELVLENTVVRDSNTDTTHSGGAIVSYGPVTLTGSRLENNSGGGGGGLYLRFEAADAIVTNSVLLNNRAVSPTVGRGGGILLWDGADITLRGTRLEGNRAMRGGGIENGFSNSSIVMEAGSRVTGNIANDTDPNNNSNNSGGGIFNLGNLTLTDTTVSDNNALSGGGIYHGGPAAVTGVTISGNTAEYGGGFYHIGGPTPIINTTFSGNSAAVGGGIEVDGSGLNLTNVTFSGNASNATSVIHTGMANITLKNVVLARGATGANCGGLNLAAIISAGFNLSSDASCTTFTQPGDQQNINPQLGPLANNGGPTWTHLPLPGSLAIDSGTASNAPATDQRGLPRPVGVAHDKGAVERQASDDVKLVYLPVVVR